ncbi:MAG: DUF4169 family protein [Pseudomonadota bacterium]
MSTPINLNKARKARRKADQKRAAEENTVKFGRTKTEKDAARRADTKALRALDGHKRET